MKQLLMYSTLGCHLCAEAQGVVVAVLGQPVPEVDIADDEQLLERYGVRIPVLVVAAGGQELAWPFDAPMLRAWLETLAVEP